MMKEDSQVSLYLIEAVNREIPDIADTAVLASEDARQLTTMTMGTASSELRQNVERMDGICP